MKLLLLIVLASMASGCSSMPVNNFALGDMSVPDGRIQLLVENESRCKAVPVGSRFVCEDMADKPTESVDEGFAAIISESWSTLYSKHGGQMTVEIFRVVTAPMVGITQGKRAGNVETKVLSYKMAVRGDGNVYYLQCKPEEDRISCQKRLVTEN